MNQKGLLALIIILIVLIFFILIGLFFYFRSDKSSLVPNVIKNLRSPSTSEVSDKSSPNFESLPMDPSIVPPTPSIIPILQCQKAEDCVINYEDCTATTRVALESNTNTQKNTCPGDVKCMYGGCALVIK